MLVYKQLVHCFFFFHGSTSAENSEAALVFAAARTMTGEPVLWIKVVTVVAGAML